jgi:hypothetical protein
MALREPQAGNHKAALGHPSEGSGTMATSSHDPTVQHLPYNALYNGPDNHHIYASFTPWTSPPNVSDSSHSTSAMFQRHGSSNQHQLPVSNPQNYGPLGYANLHRTQTSWPSTTNYRIGVDCDESLCSRPTDQYGYAPADTPGLQTNCARLPRLTGTHDLLHAANAQPQNNIITSQPIHDNHFAVSICPQHAHAFPNLTPFSRMPTHQLPRPSCPPPKGLPLLLAF